MKKSDQKLLLYQEILLVHPTCSREIAKYCMRDKEVYLQCRHSF